MHFISFEAPVNHDDRVVGHEPPPGHNLTEFIRKSASAAGFEIFEGITQHDSYGWCFTVRTSSGPVWCMLQLSDEWLLITNARLSLWQRLQDRRPAAEHSQLDATLVAALSSAPHVANVQWFGSEADFRQGRAGRP